MTNHKPSTAARVLVLSGPAFALIFSLLALATGNDVSLIGSVWFWVVIWTFLTAGAGAVWRAFRGDRSAFTGYRLPEKDADRFDWATRTGRHAWRRDDEENELHAHDDCPGHGPIT